MTIEQKNAYANIWEIILWACAIRKENGITESDMHMCIILNVENI